MVKEMFSVARGEGGAFLRAEKNFSPQQARAGLILKEFSKQYTAQRKGCTV